MQYCKKCGVENEEGSIFCQKCGASLLVSGIEEDGSSGGRAGDGASRRGDFSMLWYDFVIYAQLFIMAFIDIFCGVSAITGDRNGKGVSFSRMMLDRSNFSMIIGIMLICLGVYAVFVRQKLAHFKKRAPLMYYIYLVANYPVTMVYSFMAGYFSIGANIMYSNIVLIVASVIYFHKRKVLFVE